MLLIRSEQMEAFSSPYTPLFEFTTKKHIKSEFPKHYVSLEKAGVQDVIDYGRARAKKYGFTDSTTALLYIDLTLLLGREFDEDIQLHWAARILKDASLTQPLVKAERLHEYAMAYLDEVSGVENEHIEQALETLLLLYRLPFSSHKSDSEQFEQEVLDRLGFIWPQKLNYLKEATALELISRGVEKMRNYDISAPNGALIGIVAMYMLGSGFDRDPVFPWAGRILKNKDLSPSERTERLYNEGLNHLKTWVPPS